MPRGKLDVLPINKISHIFVAPQAFNNQTKKKLGLRSNYRRAFSMNSQIWTPSCGIVFKSTTLLSEDEKQAVSHASNARFLYTATSKEQDIRNTEISGWSPGSTELPLGTGASCQSAPERDGGVARLGEDEDAIYSKLPAAVGPQSCSPRGFHIPEERLRLAQESKVDDPGSYWQYTMYHGPGGPGDKIRLHYCKTIEAAESVSKHFMEEDVLGFDIEWIANAKSTDGIKKNVSLIQIASEDRIALFHLARFHGPEDVESLVPPIMKALMESPRVTKVGVAIKADCTRLRNFLGIHCQGLFELSYLHKLIMYRSGNIDKVDKRAVRLADQVQEHIGLPILKDEVQVGDWSKDLSLRQSQYAASDAYANFQLYHAMEARRLAFDPILPKPAHAELNLEIAPWERPSASSSLEDCDESEESSDDASVSGSDISVEELATQYFNVSLEDTPKFEKSFRKKPAESRTKASSTKKSRLTSEAEPGPRSRDPSDLVELDEASKFADSHKATHGNAVKPQPLRAYFLWHKQGLDIPRIAAILRDPPIQNKTVVNYLFEAYIGLPKVLKCPPEKIFDVAYEYEYQGFNKAQEDLLFQAALASPRTTKRNHRGGTDITVDTSPKGGNTT